MAIKKITINIEFDNRDDNFVDFKGWRFREPFRCMCCGRRITMRQFCFGRACAGCDCGKCNGHQPNHRKPFSGPRELIDRDAEYFIEDARFSNPETGLASHSKDKDYGEMLRVERALTKT